MGSSISNVISERKMRKRDKNVIDDHKTEIRTWINYVDDIFIITTNRINLRTFLSEINLYDKTIQFTIKEDKIDSYPTYRLN